MAAWQAPPTGQRGRSPFYSNLAIETGHLLRCAFGRPWRQTEGLLRSVVTLLGVNLAIPDHTTFSRRSAGLSLVTALPPTPGPVHVVMDSTGLKVYGAGEWHQEKHGERGRRTWRKLHLAVNPDSGEILASELTTREVGDLSMVGPLLEQIQSPLLSVMADGAYDGESVYQAIAARQPDSPPAVIIPPRVTAVLSPTADVAPMWVAKSFVILRAARTWGRGYQLCAEPLAGGVGAPTRLPVGLTRRCWPLGDSPQSASSTPSTSGPLAFHSGH